MIARLSGSFGLAAIAQHQMKGSYHTPPRPGRDQSSKFEEQFLMKAYCTTVKKWKKNVSRTVVIWRLSLSGFLSHAGYTHPFQAFSKVSSRYDIRFRLFETCLFKNVIASIYFFLVALGLHYWAWTFLQLRGSGTTICCSAWLLWLQDTGSRHAGLLAAAPPLESMGSAVVAHVLNWPMACGIFSDQGSNPRPLHWQVGSYLLHYQGIPSDASFFFLSSLLQLLLDHPLRSLRSTTV